MSSILRALKKLESELPHPADALPLPRKIDTKKTISRQAKRLLRFNVLFIAFVGVLTLTVAGWFIFGQKIHRSRKPVPAATLTQPDASVITTAAEPKAKKQNILPKSVAKIKGAAQKPVKRVDKTLLTPASSPSTVSADKARRKSKTVARRATLRKADQKLKSVTPIGDNRLKLQAISWDKSSKKRIAVINNRIVREGESVDGFLVNLIGKDAVLVREGENEWKLMFSFK